MTATDRIFIEGISFLGHHGVSRKERAEGRQMLVDIVANFDTRAAAASDALDDTVNHEDLARIAFEIGTASSFRLLETLADRICASILSTTPALSVEVRVRKLNPTLSGLPTATGVSIARDREHNTLEARLLHP